MATSSRTVRRSMSMSSVSTNEKRVERWCTLSDAMSLSAMNTFPSRAGCRPARVRNRVLLPEPLVPVRQMRSRGEASRLRFRCTALLP